MFRAGKGEDTRVIWVRVRTQGLFDDNGISDRHVLQNVSTILSLLNYMVLLNAVRPPTDPTVLLCIS